MLKLTNLEYGWLLMMVYLIWVVDGILIFVLVFFYLAFFENGEFSKSKVPYLDVMRVRFFLKELWEKRKLLKFNFAKKNYSENKKRENEK